MSMAERKSGAILINPKDNVAIAIAHLKKGEKVVARGEGVELEVELLDDIPFGHKFAIVSMAPGTKVLKYGEVIGETTAEVVPGQHVHTHNIRGLRGQLPS
jgi:altronate dehydratase small subunit